MKILKYGEGYPKTVTCEHCNSELEYDAADIFNFTNIYIDYTETTDYIKCPVCSKSIKVDVHRSQFYTDKPKKRWW
jgi:transcription elongation factor Elf1